MDKIIYRIIFSLSNTVDVDVSKHMTSFQARIYARATGARAQGGKFPGVAY
jgi:hypothetical protein